jgi:hypothetical protein
MTHNTDWDAFTCIDTPDLIAELHDGCYFADETYAYDGNGPYLTRVKAEQALSAYVVNLYPYPGGTGEDDHKIVISNCVSIMGK